jgi:integrase
MATGPHPHGPRFRVRWYCPGHDVRQSWVLDSDAEGVSFRRWLESPAIGERVLRNDERIQRGTWNKGGRIGSTGYTFGAFFEKHLVTRGGGSTEVSKQKERDRFAARLKGWEKVPVEAITRDEILGLVASMKAKNYAPSVIYNTLLSVSGVLKAAWQQNVIPENPLTADADTGRERLNLRRISGYDRQPRMRANSALRISPEEWEKLLTAARTLGERRRAYMGSDPMQLYYQLRLLIETGMRVGEMLALRVGNCVLDQAAPYIVLEYTRLPDGTDGPTKSRQTREVALGTNLAAHLARICEGRDSQAAVFRAPLRGDRGWRYTTWWNSRWNPLIELAKTEFALSARLDIHPHALRMNFITWARNDGSATTRDIQLQVGHTSEAVTLQYDLGSDHRAVRAAVDKWVPAFER